MLKWFLLACKLGRNNPSPSSSGSQIGEQQSSYSPSSGVVARVSHFHSSSTGEKAEGLVLAWRNLPLVRNWSCFQKLLIVNLHGRAENRRNSSRPF